MTTEPSDSARTRAATTDSQHSTTDRPTVLIVDDEPDLVDLHATWLRDDYDVRTATGGEEALKDLTEAVDVVLLDRRMPNLTGDAVLERVRERGLDCRVAMVTAVDPDVDVIEMGFDDYLTKPASRREVRALVERLLELRDYDELLQEYFALASKLATLEANVEAERLEENDDYRALLDRFSEVKVEARSRITTLMEEDGGERTFRRIVNGWRP